MPETVNLGGQNRRLALRKCRLAREKPSPCAAAACGGGASLVAGSAVWSVRVACALGTVRVSSGRMKQIGRV